MNRGERRALKQVDAVVTPAAGGAPGTAAMRLGVDPEFHPLPGIRRTDTVLFAGELSWSAGVFELLWATSQSSTPWPLLFIGRGHQRRALERRAANLGLSHRVRVEPFIADRAGLAATFAAAGCVVSPGPPHRGQLVTLEAAACGVPVVAPEGAPIASVAPWLTHPYPPHINGRLANIEGLANAIRAALTAPRPDPEQGTRLQEAYAWERAFKHELTDLRAHLERS